MLDFNQKISVFNGIKSDVKPGSRKVLFTDNNNDNTNNNSSIASGGIIIAEARVTVACVDAVSGSPTTIPPDILSSVTSI